jgi:hypothetical protein
MRDDALRKSKAVGRGRIEDQDHERDFEEHEKLGGAKD